MESVLITTFKWFYLFHLLTSPPVLPSVSADEGSAGHRSLSICPQSGATTIHRWRNKQLTQSLPPVLSTLALPWRGKEEGGCLSLLLLFSASVASTQIGFRIFAEWNRKLSSLNAAWGLMSRTILSLKVSCVYFTCDHRDKASSWYCIAVKPSRCSSVCSCLLNFSAWEWQRKKRKQ